MNFQDSTVIGARSFARLMTAQALSTYANQVISFVVPWLVLSRTGSAVNAGTVVFAMGLASFVGILIGGPIIDQVGGRKVSIIADGSSLVTAVALAVALQADFLPLWYVVVSQVVGVFFDGPGTIAKNTLVPDAAQQNGVPMARAMGLQQTFQNMAMFLGPVSAGVLISIFPESITLLSTGTFFLGCAVLVFGLPEHTSLDSEAHRGSKKQAVIEMMDAARFIIREPFLGPMQLFGSLYAFILMPISAIIVPAWFVFAQKGSESLGVFLGAQALGGMIGGFVFATFGPKVSQHKWLAGSTIGYALAIVSLSFLPPGSFEATAASLFLGLVSTGIMAIPYTAFYTRTPERLLGRVNSLGAATGFLVVSISSLLWGWLVHFYSAPIALLMCGAGMGILAIGAKYLPFMKLLDEKSPSILPAKMEEDVTGKNKPIRDCLYSNKLT